MAIVMAGLTWYAYHTTSKGVSSLTRWRGHEGKLSLLYLRVAHRSPKINSLVDATTITEKRCWTPIFLFLLPEEERGLFSVIYVVAVINGVDIQTKVRRSGTSTPATNNPTII